MKQQSNKFHMVCRRCGRIFKTAIKYNICSRCSEANIEDQPVEKTQAEKICKICGQKSESLYKDTCSNCYQKNYHAPIKQPPKRKCHDCGKPTSNYRCNACWVKLRARLGLGVNISSDEEDYL